MIVRRYGDGPYRVAAVHGGPGAAGSAAGLARGIAEKFGVIEPIQTRVSIDGLIDELRDQLEQYGTHPSVLVGHSWGAWLAGLTAARYPDIVGKVILIGCGPLDVKYVEEIGLRRARNMTPEEYAEYKALLSCLNDPETPDRDRKLSRLGALAEKADGFDEMDDTEVPEDAFPANGEMYGLIMPEALRIRESGQLLAKFRRIKCPIVLIQGAVDSHPHHGVTEPLSACGVAVKSYILEKCGHTPWKERQARDAFFKILFKEISSN